MTTHDRESLRKLIVAAAGRRKRERIAIRDQLCAVMGTMKRPSAKASILFYLKLFVGEPIRSDELEIVSGISEYARRIRELRVEEGYDIVSDLSDPGLPRDSYALRSAKPDASRARRWKTVTEIRRSKGGAKSKMLQLLKRYVAEPISGDELFDVSGVKEYGRRLRELRTEDGYRVVTRNTGRPDLAVGVYVLENDKPLPPHDRKIPDATYEAVLIRDRNSCRKCGWDVSQRTPGSRRQFLEVHHKLMHSRGGTQEITNLVTLCNMHHDEVHRLNIGHAAIDAWLR